MTQCEGLTAAELSTLDFSQIDLSEWIATLYDAEMIPEPSEDGLTGSGRMINEFSRDTVSDRTQDRMEGVGDNMDDVRNYLRDPNIDCSTSPRPPVCEFGFDPEEEGGGASSGRNPIQCESSALTVFELKVVFPWPSIPKVYLNEYSVFESPR